MSPHVLNAVAQQEKTPAATIDQQKGRTGTDFRTVARSSAADFTGTLSVIRAWRSKPSFEAVELRSLNQLPDSHPSVEKTADLLVVAVLVHAPS